MWVEGARVAFVGDDGPLPVGTIGTVLADAGSGAHVLWPTGIMLMASMDITAVAATAGHDGLDDSLDVGVLRVEGVRRIADQQGVAGVLNVMADSGHLANFPQIADEAWNFIQGRIRADAAIRAVAEELPDEDAEALYATATAALIRDAFAGDE